MMNYGVSNTNQDKAVMQLFSPILKAPLLLGTVEVQAIHHPLVTDINLK
jgi:hypothetical protein